MIYIVNELCELEQETYTNCHGAFTDKVEAYKMANELYNQAKEDLDGKDLEYCSVDMKVWNSTNTITISVDEVKLTVSETDIKNRAIEILDIFEDVLQENNIKIPDEHRVGLEEEACIFGETYYHTEDEVQSVLKNLLGEK